MKYRVQQAAGDPGAGGGAGGGGAGGDPNAGGGGAPAPWFSDEQKPFVETKGWKAPGDAITSFQNLEKLFGADKAGRTVVMPKDDKDVEGIKAFHAKLGVPESADKYELPIPDGDKGEFAKTAADWFHKAGVPKTAAQAVAKNWNEFITGIVQKEQADAVAASQQELTQLKTTWGAEFDKNSEFARRFLRAAGWDDAKVKIYEETFGTAQMLKDFHGFGSKFQEGGFAGSGGTDPTFGVSKQAAQSKLEEIRKDRAEGKINDAQWKGGKQAEYEKYAQIVAAA